MPRGQDVFVMVLQWVRLRFKTSLALRSQFLIMFFPISLRLDIIGCLTPSLTEGILVQQIRIKLLETMARSTMIIVLRERIIVLLWQEWAQG